jgi:hypothetical protein
MSKEAVLAVRERARRLCTEYAFAHTTIEIEWGEDACHMAAADATRAADS